MVEFQAYTVHEGKLRGERKRSGWEEYRLDRRCEVLPSSRKTLILSLFPSRCFLFFEQTKFLFLDIETICLIVNI